MIERRGVIMALFDLPVKTTHERRSYTGFRKALVRHGYSAFQKSVYVKLLRNISSAGREISFLQSEAPRSGNVRAMVMSLNVFKATFMIRGDKFNMSFFSDDVVSTGAYDEMYAPDVDDFSLLFLETDSEAAADTEPEGQGSEETV